MKESPLDGQKNVIEKIDPKLWDITWVCSKQDAGETETNRSEKLCVNDYAQTDGELPEIVECLLSRCHKRKKVGTVCVAKRSRKRKGTTQPPLLCVCV